MRTSGAFLLVAFVACGAPSPPRAPAPSPPTRATSSELRTPETSSPATSSPATEPSAAPSPAAPAEPVDAASAFARLRTAFSACIEVGKRSAPSMRDGRVTLHASLDASGRAACVVPSDVMGITAEVQDCMASRFASETFAPPGSSLRLPLALRGGELALAEEKAPSFVLASVETHRMPDAFDVIEDLLPKLQACLDQGDPARRPKSLLVAARVANDGRPSCALTATSEPAPAVAACTTSVLRGATFPRPIGGAGLVLVPIQRSRR